MTDLNAERNRATLLDSLRHNIGFSIKRAYSWGVLYYGLRGAIIILSIFASGKLFARRAASVFAGENIDPSTGLVYLRARYYDPQQGRFVSEDPAGRAGGANPYLFAGDDPVNGRDPSGKWCEQRYQTINQSSVARASTDLAKTYEPIDSTRDGYWYLHCEDLDVYDLGGIAGYLGGLLAQPQAQRQPERAIRYVAAAIFIVAGIWTIAEQLIR